VVVGERVGGSGSKPGALANVAIRHEKRLMCERERREGTIGRWCANARSFRLRGVGCSIREIRIGIGKRNIRRGQVCAEIRR